MAKSQQRGGSSKKKQAKSAASMLRKKTYRVTNWREYNESLVRRGDITLWFGPKVIDDWEHPNVDGRVGHPFLYSDTAIETLLVLRELFRLPYRQTEGLGRAIAALMQADIRIPDFTSLAKRSRTLNVQTKLRTSTGPIDLVIDSTGLKVYGPGEWQQIKHHARSGQQWRKVHLGIDVATQAIVCQELTASNVHDATMVEPLIEQVTEQVASVIADGAYDQRKVYQGLQAHSISAIIPPRKNAKIWQHGNSGAMPLDRDESLRCIRHIGREAWQQDIGYHRRSLIETAMSRLKRTFGGHLRARSTIAQATELALRCKLLNWFVILGLPLSTWN